MASPTEAIRDFLAPIMASYCRVIDEGSSDMPVTISFGGYKYETTLADFKALDKAHQEAFDRNEKAAANRRAKKSVGTLI